MRSVLQKVKRLLFIRLLLIFAVTTVSVLIVVYVALELSKSDETLEPVRNNLSRYVEYLVQDIGVPPNVTVAKRISDSVLLDIAIIYGDQIWRSKPEMLIPESARKAIVRPQFVKQAGTQYYFLARGPFTFIFSIPEPRRFEFHPYLPLLLLSAIFVILFLAYKAVGRLFRPIQLIKEGAQRIGKGDLSYRLPEIREDELGELTVEINHMAEEVEKLLEAKRQLLLAISHELRSPITRATVTLEFIEDRKVRESLRQDLEAMERLTQELLETEKLNSQHFQLHLQTYDFRSIVNEVIDENFSDNAARFNIELASTPCVVTVDLVRMKLVVKNLIDNAIRYSSRSAEKIKIVLKDWKDELVFSVEDQGEGIAREHVPYLAQAFYRADASRQRKTGGYGLGLYLCRLVVEAHKGTLEIESQEGKGTSVSIRLPKEKNN